MLKVPKNTRIYTIADIHGCSELLLAMLDAIRQDAEPYANQRRILITLGDYIDRGPDSFNVIETLIRLPLPGFEAKHLKGNHEDLFIDFLKNPIEGLTWLSNGGWATLLSYGFEVSDLPESLDDLSKIQLKLLERLPKEHVSFFKSLRLFYKIGDYYFVHAGIRPNIPLEKQKEEDLLWIRSEFINSREAFEKVIVHGHTISKEPDEQPNRVGLDTGAFHTGVLTCMVLNATDRYFLQARTNGKAAIKLESKLLR